MTVVSSEQYVEEGKTLLNQVELSPIPYVPNGSSLSGMDCQGLAEYLLNQCGVPWSECNLSGSNAHWRNCIWRGTPEECVKQFGCVPPGAWPFIVSEVSSSTPAKYRNDGLGDAEHMGVYLGDGVAVHASASRKCVARSTFKEKTIKNGGWNAIGLPPWIDFGLAGSNKEPEGVTIMVAIYDAKVVTTGGHLNFRSSPRVGGTDIGDIPNGALLQVFEETNEEWAKVYWNHKHGYVMRKFLSKIGDPTADSSSDADDNNENVTLVLPRSTAERLLSALNAAL